MKKQQETRKYNPSNTLDKRIEKLEQLGNERRAEDDFALALAYLKRTKGEWSDRKKLEKTVELLQGIKPIVNAALGNALFNLDQWGIALPYLEDALDEITYEPHVQFLEKLLQYCEESMTYPLFKEPFNERVKKAWQEFIEKDSQIRALVEKKIKDGTPAVVLGENNTFRTALDQVQCWVEKEDGKYVIHFLTGYNVLRSLELQYIKEQMPEIIQKNWDIVIGTPPSKDEKLGIVLENGTRKTKRPDFDIKTIEIWVKEQGNLFSIEAYCDDWDPFLEHASTFEDEEEVVETALEEFLGEIIFDKYIKSITILDEPLSKPSMTIPEVPKLFLDKGIDIHAPTNAILERAVTYRNKPNKEEFFFPREDITKGSTTCMKLLDAYKEEEQIELDVLEVDGVTTGYLYYPTSSFKGGNASKEAEDFRQSLIKELEEKAGPEAVKIIGEAHGEEWDYIDIVVWNLPKVLKTVEEFFENSSVKYPAYHVFRKQAGSVLLMDGKVFVLKRNEKIMTKDSWDSVEDL